MTRAEILYWRVENPEHFSVRTFPIFKEVVTRDEKNIQQFFNGIPILEYPKLLKVKLNDYATHSHTYIYMLSLSFTHMHAHIHTHTLSYRLLNILVQ